MRSFTTLLTTALLLALSASADAVQTATDVDGVEQLPETPPLAALQGGGPTLDQAVERVRRRYPGGRIVGASTTRRGRCEVHVIRVLTRDGTVKQEEIRGRCD